MPQSLADLNIHLVFSTKHRSPLLTDNIRPQLYPYLGGILRNINCHPIQIGGVADHVHILFGLSRTLSMAQLVEKVKTASTKWLKENGSPDFAWQLGYGALSVGSREVEQMTAYIRGQEKHHATMSYQDELRSLLQEAGLEFDERYLWD
ncbi:MAG: IS200/IS605 family transposase [Fimbriimonadaceae bacterium]